MKLFNISNHKIFKTIVPIGAILFGVSSCAVSETASSTNDGIYYDPSEDTIPSTNDTNTFSQNESPVTAYNNQEPIRIGGKYFDSDGNAPEETYVEEDSYYDESEDNNIAYNDDYSEWGDSQGTEIVINNYGSGFYSPYYNPYFGFSPRYQFSFGIGYSYGWGGFLGNPYFSPFYSPFYGRPYYGYNGFYNPYYGYPYYPQHNFYNNQYITNVYRGKGNHNMVSTRNDRNSNQNNRADSNNGVRRGDEIHRGDTPLNATNQIEQNSIKPRRKTDKVRVSRGSSNAEKVFTRSNRAKVSNSSKSNINTRSTDKVRIRRRSTNPAQVYGKPNQTVTRPRTVNPKRKVQKASAYNKRQDRSVRSTPNRSYNNGRSSRSGNSGRRGGVRRK